MLRTKVPRQPVQRRPDSEKFKARLKDTSAFSILWYYIHEAAKEAVTEEKKRFFRDYLQFKKRNFTCMNCLIHFESYLEQNPLEPYWNLKTTDGEEIGLFKWSWIFHNTVNARLGKPVFSWEDAYSLYYDVDDGISVCFDGCGAQPSDAAPPKSASREATEALPDFFEAMPRPMSPRRYRRRRTTNISIYDRSGRSRP